MLQFRHWIGSPQERHRTKVENPRRLSRTRLCSPRRRLEGGEQTPRQDRFAAHLLELAAHVDPLDGRQTGAANAAGEGQQPVAAALGMQVGFHGGRRRPDDDDGL